MIWPWIVLYSCAVIVSAVAHLFIRKYWMACVVAILATDVLFHAVLFIEDPDILMWIFISGLFIALYSLEAEFAQSLQLVPCVPAFMRQFG